jgi:uncharacterized protein with NAD-binding domain and iron-sulfur cluster
VTDAREENGRLIILGGGIAALTTAFYASEESHRRVFPNGIHVYEKEDHLGGKGASRRADSPHVRARIEEHGLHVWFGFYDNAFALLAKCHTYLEEQVAKKNYKRWSSSLRDVADGFRPCSRVAVMDYDGSRWLPWAADFPEDPTVHPWDARRSGERLGSVEDLAGRALRLVESLLYALAGRPAASGRPHPTLLDASLLPVPVQLPKADFLTRDAEVMLAAARESRTGLEQLSRLLALLAGTAKEVRYRLDEPVRSHSGLRRTWYVVDLLLAAVRGLIDEGIVLTGNFEPIDRYDLRAWLILHGASEESVSSGVLKALVYDLAFAYAEGKPEQPSCSAATGVYGLLRLLLTYRGAIMWKMNAGMGEVVFAPIYEALLRRGVKFHFGHEVEQISLARRNGRALAKQIVFGPAKGYVAPSKLEHLSVENGPLAGKLPYWRAQEQRRMRTPAPINLGPNDMVVYGLPVGTIAGVIPRAPEPWRICAEKVKTVSTACLQLWLNVPVDRYAPWSTPDVTAGAYAEPFDTWSDMKVLAGEVATRKAKPIRSVAYFTNVAPDGVSEQDLRALVDAFITGELTALWPQFDPNMVVDKYPRLNDDASDRYTLSLPGSMAARLSPQDDSIANVRPVGDWTRTSISAGCIEAAVISGMIAARVLRPDRGLPIFAEDL